MMPSQTQFLSTFLLTLLQGLLFILILVFHDHKSSIPLPGSIHALLRGGKREEAMPVLGKQRKTSQKSSTDFCSFH